MKLNKLKLLKNAFAVFLVWLLINVPAYSSESSSKEAYRKLFDYYKTHDFGDNLELDFFVICLIIGIALYIWSIIKNIIKEARENNRKNQ